eukprot:TRINITY_DN7129_c0_g2_i1.p1 TRINITY_DN7129_c0_g2~~TRINITY_DN7129_c0_g2_i1.p1  ORF type:complete len:1189 (+),score=431.02 TRINITY_DN7129_c0_g2_i1:48-3614(+)
MKEETEEETNPMEKTGFLCFPVETSLFLSFPVATRAIIAQNTCEFLLRDSTPHNLIQNEQHVEMIMESVGPAFSLPMDHSMIIKSCTELYRRWLVDFNPEPIQNRKDQVTIRIYQQFAMLFEMRDNVSPIQLDTHVELCHNVLEIILKSVHVPGVMNVGIWEELLKMLLRISDSLLRGTTQLGTKLAPFLLKTVFEIWLRSHTKNEMLWKEFKETLQGWRHRLPVIAQWNATTLGLTMRMLRLTYGSEEGSQFVDIKIDTLSRIQLEDGYVFFAWHRMIDIIGDFESIQQPINYLEGIRGVHSLMNEFLAIKNVPTGAIPPSGNTILSIVGPFLLRSINVQKNEVAFDRGVAEAVVALIRLFSVRKDFTGLYLASFYRGISETISKNNYLMDVILTNCTEFFQLELPGSHILIPVFLKSVAYVLQPPTKTSASKTMVKSGSSGQVGESSSSTSQKDLHKFVKPVSKQLPGISSSLAGLRKACIRILGYLASTSHYYESIFFSNQSSDSSLVSKYSEISQALESSIFLDALHSEENPQNCQMILWTCFTYISECITTEKTFPGAFIEDLLIYSTSNLVPENVAITAIKVITAFANLNEKFRTDKKPISVTVVGTLTRFIEFSFINSQKVATGMNYGEDFIVAIYACISAWLVKDQRVIMQPEELRKLFIVAQLSEMVDSRTARTKTISEHSSSSENVGISSRASVSLNPASVNLPGNNPSVTGSAGKDKIFGSKVSQSSSFLMWLLLERVDCFPSPMGPSLSSNTLDEHRILSEIMGSKQKSNFITINFDQNVLSFIRNPKPEMLGKPNLIVSIRNAFGKSFWNVTLDYPKFNEPAPEKYAGSSTNSLLKSPSLGGFSNESDEESQKELNQLNELLVATEKRKQEMILQKTSERLQKEINFLNQENYGLNKDIYCKRPPRPNNDESPESISSSRIFLNQFGFLSLSNCSRVHSMQNLNKEIWDPITLKPLDQSQERERHTASILYVGKGSQDGLETRYDETSDDFQFMVGQVGWMTKLGGHKGFKGMLKSEEWAPYYAEVDYELIFYVGPLIPKGATEESVSASRQGILASSPILIIWSEDPVCQAVKSFKNEVIIVVHPLKNGLYHIRTHGSGANVAIGPLIGDIAVTRDRLPSLLRQTAVNANRTFKEANSKPFVQRRIILDSIITDSKVEEPGYRFLPQFFRSNQL